MSKNEKLSTASLLLYLSAEIFSLSVNHALASQFIFLDSRNNNLTAKRMKFFRTSNKDYHIPA